MLSSPLRSAFSSTGYGKHTSARHRGHASNFGVTGERPTNPELLEYLASYFVENGKSIKALHRAIMLSSVYQLSTADNPEAFAKDSGNRLYWRAEKKRLDAEQLRDGVLMTSGNLDDAMGGPSADLTPAYLRAPFTAS